MDAPAWLSSYVWTDYRLAILFTVVIPLVLLVWSFVQQSETIQKLLIIYWRVSSLLAITIYLMIGALPYSFLSGWFARILIPISLWLWADLNEEIQDQPPSLLRFFVISWRWAVSIYCVLGALIQIPTLPCAFNPTAVNDAACRIWFEPPWAFRQIFHPTTQPFFLGALGIIGLVIYLLYLGYFVFFRFSKRKRSAME
jgi:Protein of unknown function (DUF3177)